MKFLRFYGRSKRYRRRPYTSYKVRRRFKRVYRSIKKSKAECSVTRRYTSEILFGGGVWESQTTLAGGNLFAPQIAAYQEYMITYIGYRFFPLKNVATFDLPDTDSGEVPQIVCAQTRLPILVDVTKLTFQDILNFQRPKVVQGTRPFYYKCIPAYESIANVSEDKTGRVVAGGAIKKGWLSTVDGITVPWSKVYTQVIQDDGETLPGVKYRVVITITAKFRNLKPPNFLGNVPAE